MNATLDQSLIYRTKRRRRRDGLSPEERIAINLLWRRKVRPSIIAKIFKVSRNTIYYKAMTGEADSYPNTNRSNSAAETNAVIDEMGIEEAERQYLTDEIIEKVNAANRKEAARRAR
jgi:hypothetical protein